MRTPIIAAIVFGLSALTAQAQQRSSAAVTSACHVSPIVSDLDKSARFYHDILGLELVPTPPAGPLPWDADSGHLDLHGIPKAKLRFIGARMPGVFCGVELVQFANVDRKPVQRRMQDPGDAMLILLVRDLDAVFSRLKAARTPIVTTGGAPIFPAPGSKSRAVVVKDPDGHLIELAQLERQPETTAPASSNVIGIRLRVTVSDLSGTIAYYRDTLGLDAKPAEFTKGPGVMAMMGLPESGEYRITTATIPNSALVLEFIEFRGVSGVKKTSSRVQDPGAYRLQLNVQDIDATLAALKKAGSPVISTGGVAVRMAFGANPWRLAVARDLNNLFLIIQQRLQ